jgi:hypothetical protein
MAGVILEEPALSIGYVFWVFTTVFTFYSLSHLSPHQVFPATDYLV